MGCLTAYFEKAGIPSKRFIDTNIPVHKSKVKIVSLTFISPCFFVAWKGDHGISSPWWPSCTCRFTKEKFVSHDRREQIFVESWVSCCWDFLGRGQFSYCIIWPQPPEFSPFLSFLFKFCHPKQTIKAQHKRKKAWRFVLVLVQWCHSGKVLLCL